MIYTLDMVQSIGFETIESFVEDFISRHSNPYIKYVPGGVSVDYDFDTQPGLEWMGAFRKMIVSPTREQVVDIMLTNGTNINDAKSLVATFTDEMLKYKAILDDGTLLDAESKEKFDKAMEYLKER